MTNNSGEGYCDHGFGASSCSLCFPQQDRVELIHKLEAAIAENNARSDPYDATALLENNGLRKAIAIVRKLRPTVLDQMRTRHALSECDPMECLICYGINAEKEKQQILSAKSEVRLVKKDEPDTLIMACQEVLRLMEKWRLDYAYSKNCERAVTELREEMQQHLRTTDYCIYCNTAGGGTSGGLKKLKCHIHDANTMQESAQPVSLHALAGWLHGRYSGEQRQYEELGSKERKEWRTDAEIITNVFAGKKHVD